MLIYESPWCSRQPTYDTFVMERKPSYCMFPPVVCLEGLYKMFDIDPRTRRVFFRIYDCYRRGSVSFIYERGNYVGPEQLNVLTALVLARHLTKGVRYWIECWYEPAVEEENREYKLTNDLTGVIRQRDNAVAQRFNVVNAVMCCEGLNEHRIDECYFNWRT